MKRYRLFAVASALLLLCSLTGCSFSGADADSAELSSYNEPNLPRCDIEAYKAKIEDLRQNWLKSNQEEAIGQTVQELLDAVDEAYALYAHAEIDYYSDWTKDALSDYRSRTYEDMCVVSDMTGWAIVNGERKSAYPALFAPYLPDGNLDYYRLHNLQRIMSYSRQSAADSALLLDDYYDVAYDDSVDPDETDLACAGLYLDILKETSPSDYDYEAFERDYTPEDVSALYSELLETVYPLFVRLAAYFAETDPALPEQTDALQFLREHAEKLSPEIGESADKLFSEHLYTAAKGEDCYDGSFTISLGKEQSALMYLYLDGSFTDVSSVTHEFGHFHSDWRDETPVFLQKNCIDIAEAQSQSMEMLFTHFYGDLMDAETAKRAELWAVFNLLDAVISGFAIGMFEAKIMEDPEQYEAKDVVQCYADTCTAVGVSPALYQVTHLYEQPGYYVSYGVSALPALQIYTMMQDDFDAAVAQYGKISEISSVSGEYRFQSAMQACGMQNYFDSGTVAGLADALDAHISALLDE